MGLDLQSGFLFRTTCGNSVTEKPFVGSAVHNRLKFYSCKKLMQMKGKSRTVLEQGALLNSLCWEFERKTSPDTRMVDFYNDLTETLKPSSPAAALATCVSKGMDGEVKDNYRAYIDISAFKPVVVTRKRHARSQINNHALP